MGEQLKITHTHTSPFEEHPAPTNKLLLSTELQPGHTRSSNTAGCCVPALLPKALGCRTALAPYELGVLHTQPFLPAQGAAQEESAASKHCLQRLR